jgi:hypothetical protein
MSTTVTNYLRGKSEISLGPVLEHGLQLAPAQQTRAHQLRAARLLRELGWVREHTRRGKVWRAPTGWLESYPLSGSTILSGLGLSSTE